MRRLTSFLAMFLIFGAGVALAQKEPSNAVLLSARADGSVGDDVEGILGEPNTLFTIDITGVESWDLLDDPDNTVITEFIGRGCFVTGIGWNVTVSTVGASWLSEAVAYFDGSDLDGSGVFLTVGVGNTNPGTMNFDSGGKIDLTDNGIPDIPIGDDGLLYIQFFESFDDVSDAVDAVYIDDPTVAGDSVFDICAVCPALIEVPTLNAAGIVLLAALLAAAGALLLSPARARWRRA